MKENVGYLKNPCGHYHDLGDATQRQTDEVSS